MSRMTAAPVDRAADAPPDHSAGPTLHRAGRAVVQGAVEFFRSNNLTYASSIAYYSLLSFFPFVLLTLDFLGRAAVEKGDTTFLRIVALVLPTHFDFIVAQTDELSRAPLKLSVIGTVLMVWASMGVFSAVTSAINYAWGVDRPLSYFKNKLTAFLMLAASAVLFLLSLLLMSAAQVRHTEWFARLIHVVPFMSVFEGFLYRNTPVPMLILVIGLVYYFVPNTKVRLRDVWAGAITAGLLWRGAFSVFSWYLRDFSRFTVHGSIAAVVAFLVWVYVSSVILLYGVEVSAAFSRIEADDRRAQLAAAAAPKVTG